MSIESTLLDIANSTASRLQKQAAALLREHQDAEKSLSDLKAKLDAADRSLERLANFKVKIGGDYQCPICGIERDTGRAALRRARKRS
jgi:DNA repair exonuclease SbcCD ATPase subunit